MAKVKKIPDNWAVQLTPERRKTFETTGEALVEHNVLHSIWMGETKLAALAWLEEQKQAQASTDTKRFWAIFIVAFLTLIAAIIPLCVHCF